jgi:hypothetical protein
MSNRPMLITTIFENYPSHYLSYGFRMCDDYAQTYCNSMERSVLDLSPLEFLELVVYSWTDDVVTDIVDYMLENSVGIFINDTWFDWDQIKYIWKENDGTRTENESSDKNA